MSYRVGLNLRQESGEIVLSEENLSSERMGQEIGRYKTPGEALMAAQDLQGRGEYVDSLTLSGFTLPDTGKERG